MRKLTLVSALLIAVMALVISASAASAGEVLSGSQPGTNGVIVPISPASESQCPEYYAVCAWSGNEWNGTFSWWESASTGCHSHASNPYLRSFWNDSSYTIRLTGWGTLGPHLGLELPAGEAVTGEICWPA
jgi:hypothetical protein